MNRVVEVSARITNAAITTDHPLDGVEKEVMERGRIVMLKSVFPKDQLVALRSAVIAWSRRNPAVSVDDFKGNYHRQRAMVSRLQQAPHVFHDYNFNNIARTEEPLRSLLFGFFEPLRGLYNSLTGYDLSFTIPDRGPYLHPQLIQYPAGGGFFARHWHDLSPQRLGFIVSLSDYGNDYRSGGTVFEIDGDLVDMESHHQIGDICIWRYDYPHWVTQSDLCDKFDWNSEGVRWVATLAYFDPNASSASSSVSDQPCP